MSGMSSKDIYSAHIDDLVERFTREWRDADPTSPELALAELSVLGVGIVKLLGEIAKSIAATNEALVTIADRMRESR